MAEHWWRWFARWWLHGPWNSNGWPFRFKYDSLKLLSLYSLVHYTIDKQNKVAVVKKWPVTGMVIRLSGSQLGYINSFVDSCTSWFSSEPFGCFGFCSCIKLVTSTVNFCSRYKLVCPRNYILANTVSGCSCHKGENNASCTYNLYF